MPTFIAVKPTTFRGRQIAVGSRLPVNDTLAKIFEGNDAWKLEEVKPLKDKTLANAQKKAQAEAKAKLEEEQRQALLKKATELGLKPNANTGIPKLQKMIDDAKSDPGTGSVI